MNMWNAIILLGLIILALGCVSGPDPQASHSGGACLSKGGSFESAGEYDTWPQCESFCAKLASIQNSTPQNNSHWSYAFKFQSNAPAAGGNCLCLICEK